MASNLCLCMIVKNEAHILHRLFDSLYKFIDYYVISDTGSTDGTQELIKKYFAEKNINGEVHDNPWVDFGHNRTEALRLCDGKSKYILVTDADDYFEGMPNVDNLTADNYLLKFISGSTVYWRTQIIKNDPKLNWKYYGVLHEYAAPSDLKVTYTTEKLNGDYAIMIDYKGARSKDPHKYLNDVFVLEKALLTEPNNERYRFYLAQSYESANMHENAIINYKKRIEMGKWYEEVYYSYFMIAQAMNLLKQDFDAVVKSYLDAHKYNPKRAEPLYEVARLYSRKGDHDKAYEYAKKASLIEFPKDECLFVHKTAYDIEIPCMMLECAFNTKRYAECLRLGHKILKDSMFNKQHHNKARIFVMLCASQIMEQNKLLNEYFNVADMSFTPK
jgi:glycosyltransferase involved in cell wall biosynthesis